MKIRVTAGAAQGTHDAEPCGHPNHADRKPHVTVSLSGGPWCVYDGEYEVIDPKVLDGMTQRRDPYAPIAERFARETAHHKLTVLHDDGLYRHLRFQKPGTSSYAFELITVPNAFIYRGEESYVFSRLRDMFEFFRGPAGHINPGYWSEKLTSDRDCVKKYDQALFEQLVRDHVAEAVEDDPALSGLTSAARGAILESDEIGAEDGARDTLTSFAFYKNPDDRWDVDKQPDFQFTDTWEWDLKDFDWWYLWACHAIVWGIAQYDAGRKAAAPAAAPAVVTVAPVGGAL